MTESSDTKPGHVEPADLELATDCLRRAKADVEAWLALIDQGQLATLAPFGQMFVYQLKTRGKLADKAFAVGELYRLYYRKANGSVEAPAWDNDLSGKGS